MVPIPELNSTNRMAMQKPYQPTQPELTLPAVPAVPPESVSGANSTVTKDTAAEATAAVIETEKQLKDCQIATSSLKKQIDELQQQLDSNQRSSVAMSSAMQSMNREMQRLTADVEYWQAECKRLGDANQRQIESEKQTLDQIQRMLQLAPTAASIPMPDLPQVDAVGN